MIVPAYKLCALAVDRVVAGLVEAARVVESEVCAEGVTKRRHRGHKIGRAVRPVGVGLNIRAVGSILGEYEVGIHSARDTSAEKLGEIFVYSVGDDVVGAVVKKTQSAEYHTAVAYRVPVVGLELESPAGALLGAREDTAVVYNGVKAVAQALEVHTPLDKGGVKTELTPYGVEPVVDHSESAGRTRAVEEVTGAPVESLGNLE